MFNVLFCVLMLYAIVAPCVFIKFGMKIAEKTEDKAETPMFNIPAPKKKPEMTRRERQDIQKLANLMRYDGTSSGQVKISEVK